MMSDGMVIDGSWQLTIHITDLDITRTLRVTGDVHVGGVMLRLVEELEMAIDWSDHALWWPSRNMWLSRTRTTLDQYGVQADTHLEFTPMHKLLRVQLPDLQYLEMRVDFSVRVFTTVVQICKQYGIRHPEELSLLVPFDEKTIRKGGKKPENRQYTRQQSRASSTYTPGKSPGSASVGTPQATLWKTPNSARATSFNANGTLTPTSATSGDSSLVGGIDVSLAISLPPTQEALDARVCPRNYVEKARQNGGWLDSSVSLMEQGIRESDLLLFRYKFLVFYDLNPKYDAIRINQIYNQARWALLSEELDCTEEEMMMFAALQLQVHLQSNVPEPDFSPSGAKETDDIDAALNDLQMSLEGHSFGRRPGDITSIPELHDYLHFMKPKKYTLRSFKAYWFTFRDTHLSMYKSKETSDSTPLWNANLKGCEVVPDVNIAHKKYGIRVLLPAPGGMKEVWLRFENEQQYARWLSACKLASKGKTMADSSYDSEVSSILAFMSMQHPAPATVINPSNAEIQPELYVAPRFLKKFKSQQMNQRILEAHSNVSELSLYDAKMNYIRAWQALPEFGLSYFTVNFRGHKKEELIGIAFNRIVRMNINKGNALTTWRFNIMKAWNVNWEIKHVIINFEEGQDFVFYCTSADCKVIHEFIGGYIFCSMRSKESSQTLNEELFHKLTGGWS
ncbi:PREDICTED: fermitin family homolog 2-like isoform X2 [Priapulus caudatus]|uniref:Fermitin family homolog 2-like isoform X2 n=1 Tax=Priapulus caudatus TaxID=37621 RepID=A0ABM1E3Q6_PRICU|nr:PREDICTED: fermitin family homolog 2-like isoform X2 [Priapulus caudatus]